MAPIQIPGVILRTVGRTPCTEPLAVVLHEWDSGIEELDLAMQACPRPRLTCPKSCHTSFHFGIAGFCNFHQYVDIDDTAWGFGVTPPTCPEPICPPDPCASCTGLTADQFNPDFDGNVPTLPEFVADACGTANSCVIHVAVNNLFPTNQALGTGPCCDPNPNAYKCLVQSLCYIFAQTDIEITTDTLLVHCNELICLDIAQLVEDVLAFNCAVVPVSPCINCPENTLTISDTITVDLSLIASNLTANVIVSPDAGNELVSQAPGATFQTEGSVLDTDTVDLTFAADVLSADVIISPDAGNTLVSLANGLYTDRGPLSVVGIANAGTIDPTSNDDVFVYSGIGVGTATLVDPVPGEKTDLWVKNISASVFNIISASLIDGVGTITLDGTIPAGYPFGNNGGEAVHLVYDTANTTWYVV